MDDKSYTLRVPKRWVRVALIVGVTALVVAPLTAVATHSFTDVPDSNTFHADIDWLEQSEVTKGCNPPANTEFCPDDPVTREQMSAFMRRLAQYIGAEDGTPAQADNADTLEGLSSTAFQPAGNYLTEEDAEQRYAMHWLIINNNGSVRAASPGLEDTEIFRPASQPTGIYCLVFPDEISIDRNGIVGSVEDWIGGVQDWGIAINTTINTDCSEGGNSWDVAVTTTQTTGTGPVLVDTTSRLLIPPRR